MLTLRNVGLAQLEEDRPKEARATFAKLADVLPGEPLPLANGAVAALREKDLAGAEALLEKAFALGDRADLQAIRAALENERNRPAAVRAALEKAAALNPRDLESRWRFARSVETDPSATPAEKAARRSRLAEIVARSSSNLPARLKLLVLEGDAGDAAALAKGLLDLDPLVSDGDARARQFLAEGKALSGAGEVKGATVKVRVLENLLRVTPRYQQSLAEVFTPVVGLPLPSFSASVEQGLRAKGGTAVPVALRAPAASEESLGRIARKVDLKNSGTPEVYSVPAPFTGAAFFDYDLDGDLDFYLFGGGKPDQLLRNNLDGTFTDVTAKTGDAKFTSRRVVVSDVDRDGDLDLVTIDAKGDVVLRLNLRQGVFRSVPLGVHDAVDLAVEDVDADGFPDIAVATAHGLRLLMGKGDGSFLEGAGNGLDAADASTAMRAVAFADLDNDGYPDVIAATSAGKLLAFRDDGNGRFSPWPIFSSPSKKNSFSSDLASVEAILGYDVDKDGDLDLLVSAGGKTFVLVNDGGNANGWLDVVLEGLPTGSGKVNRQGVGSFIEVKAGLLYVARTVGLPPTTHFGLGAQTKANVVRATWTNGIPQNLFDQKARTVVKEVQQLKGSCPFVYALNGGTGVWTFVSDALGKSPIGLLYDGVHLAGADPREWLYIDGAALKPDSGGRLRLDYTEELWEVAFLDEATLTAVDHPEGTGVVPNERAIPGVTEKKIFTVSKPRPVRAAFSDASGRPEDVTSRLARRDQVYVSPGPEMFYQGVRKEHSLVLDLGDVKAGDRIVLYLSGWIFYTDTSINVSLSQRKDVAHFPPLLEVPDGAGGWKIAMESFGFPAGKTKTMPVDLTGLVDPKDPRVRIRTTMAIFWDEAFVTVNDPAVEVVTTSLAPSSAFLSERGFPRGSRETPDGPEVFDHGDVSRVPRWEDVPGRVTRLGDVTELLVKADDRWVAFKGGDAIRITYDASKLPPLRTGWRRDYILVSDGWDKDFDKNTVTGQSYEPWPFHAMSAYPYPASERHPDPKFLEETLTRIAGPDAFRTWFHER